ncbi:glycosyltransferase [Ectothiorhodospiraceae bacterium 2226]|nr:glycosyltransferase [Ectothiorhodospiraceae bacterium 2226]
MNENVTLAERPAAPAVPLRILMIGVHPQKTPGGMATAYELYRDAGLDQRVALRYRASHAEGSLGYRLMVALWATLRVSVDLALWRPDVVHLMVAAKGSFFRKSIYVWMAWLFGRRSLCHMQASSFQEFTADLPKWALSYVRATLARAEVVALSPKWADFYARLRGDSRGVHVLGNPARLPPAPVRHGGLEKMQILFMGRLGARKGIWDLLNALDRLRDRDDWYAYLAGDGELDAVREKLSALGLADRVEVAGWLSQEELEHALGRPSIVVLPSHREGLPLALVQGMAWGHPVVSTRIGGIPDLVEEGRNGLLVPPGEPSELAAAIERLLADPTARQRFGAANREKVEAEYAVGVLLQELLQIYQREPSKA